MPTQKLRCDIDSAAVFAISLSLWKKCHEQAAIEPKTDLSDAYSGIDSLMREIMRIAQLFEAWACDHVDFDQLSDVWPYLLQDRFREICLGILLPEKLTDFDESDCRRIAARLRLTFK